MDAIELDRLTLRMGKQTIVEEVSLVVSRSNRAALLGESGSGKTSLLRTIAGFVRPEEGRVLLFGQNVTNLLPERRGISMLFQDPVLFPGLTVQENARLAAGRLDRVTADDRIEKLARDFIIERKLDTKVHDGLSGGERQRAALVRTFANTRDILLLDEPLRGAFNVELKWQLLHAIRDRIVREGTTAVIVTHDFVEAAYLADKIAVLHDGSLFSGTPDEIYNRPPTLEVGLVVGPANVVEAGQIAASLDQFPLRVDGEMPSVASETDLCFFRPEKLRLAKAAVGFRVQDSRFLGSVRRIELTAPNGVRLEAHVAPDQVPTVGEIMSVNLSSRDIVVFDSAHRRKTQ